MKATDGEELRNKISKDFEMVGEVGRTGSVRHAGLRLHMSTSYSEKSCANES